MSVLTCTLAAPCAPKNAKISQLFDFCVFRIFHFSRSHYPYKTQIFRPVVDLFRFVRARSLSTSRVQKSHPGQTAIMGRRPAKPLLHFPQTRDLIGAHEPTIRTGTERPAAPGVAISTSVPGGLSPLAGDLRPVVFRNHLLPSKPQGPFIPMGARHMTTNSQADRVITKFGGPRALRNAMASAGHPRDLVSIYRWRYPKPNGTGGRIPSSAWPGIHAAARLEGIHLTSEDLDPRPLEV